MDGLATDWQRTMSVASPRNATRTGNGHAYFYRNSFASPLNGLATDIDGHAYHARTGNGLVTE